jgi:RimJ/RimL family protein N-acetyltransferase
LNPTILIRSIGLVNLWNINWTHSRAEIGIWIIPSCWREGYGKQAIDLIKIVGFNHLKLNRLEAHVITKNEHSINLFLTCGFKKECTLEKYLNVRRRFYDAILLVALNSLL